jgi:cell division septum initiation protein DivIVA
MTQGAKVFLGAGMLGAAYLTFMRRAGTHGAAGGDARSREERLAFYRGYEPQGPRLPTTQVERKEAGQRGGESAGGGPVHVVPSDRMNVGTETTPAVPPVGTTASLWEKQKQRGGLDAVARGNVNGTDMAVERSPSALKSPLRPSEYVEREGLADTSARATGAGAAGGAATQAPRRAAGAGTGEGVGVLDRLSEVKDVVKEHAKAAAEDVSQAAAEVGRVVSEHGRQAGRDVAGATSEVARAVTDNRPLGEVRVRDTPELVRPEVGRGQLDTVRSVPLPQGSGASGATTTEASRTADRYSGGGGGFRERVSEDVERGRERVSSEAERLRDKASSEAERVREKTMAEADRLRDKASWEAERVRDKAAAEADRVGQRAAGAVGAVKGAGSAAAETAKSVRGGCGASAGLPCWPIDRK